MNARPSAPARRPSVFVRVARALSVTTVEPPKEDTKFVAGSDFAAAQASPGTYSPKRAMSALVANPWLYTAVSQNATSLSALPLVVEQVDADGNWTAVPEHEVALLFGRPTTWQTQRQWRKQLLTCYQPNGWVCILQTRTGDSGLPDGLIIMHPNRTSPVPGAFGAPLAWEYNESGTLKRYSPDDVIFLTMPWTGEGPNGAILGTGWVQPADLDIQSDASLAASSAKKAKRGRPEAAYRPADKDKVWGPGVVGDMRLQLERLLKESDGGVAVMSGAGVFEKLEWTMAEMQGAELRAYAREVIIAITGVPPTLMGLQSANYATAQMERANYYEATLQPLAADIDDVLTDAVRRWGYSDLRVRHDFTSVAALQEDRTIRLQRVGMWVQLGASPSEAAAYEGFDDAPELSEIQVPDESQATPEDEEDAETAPTFDEDTRSQLASVRDLLTDDEAEDDELREEVMVLIDLLGSVAA